jgi:hypothetical protein
MLKGKICLSFVVVVCTVCYAARSTIVMADGI